MLYFVVLYGSIILSKCNDLDVEETKPNVCIDCGTELINEEESVLFISTLDGTFIGVDRRKGEVLWEFKEEAAVKVPQENKDALMPIFLPDPKDGSLYMLNSENDSGLKKLQFTIQQLVSTSPCRSADGIFYTGKKVDNWFMVDWRTGVKEELLGFDHPEKVCPAVNRNTMFLGRTEYNLIIHDITRRERKWNVTFYDYSAKIMPPEILKSYEHIYFSGSSTGKFAVMSNADGGSLMWETEFESPVIGVYVREGDGLVALPFTTMDDSSMHLLASKEKRVQLYSTLYVGEHTYGKYALPAVATTGSTILLLDGPSSLDPSTVAMTEDDTSADILGYYKMPEYSAERLQITGKSDAIIEMNRSSEYARNTSSNRQTLKTVAIQTEENTTKGIEFDRYVLYRLVNFGLEYALSQENMGLKVFMAGMVIMIMSMFMYFRAQMRELKQSSSGSSRGSALSGINGTVTALAEELPDGSTKVGKIVFDPDHILGKGCEGTFVFRGQFDNRNVAVKRLLPECFTVADREVCLLRESDQHPNVIRYFCMEQDKMFRYIALELCAATVQEYTEKGVLSDFIEPKEVLAQATAGLEHLHSLSIVHRDIKPHNVLLSFPSQQENKVRAMISDFGLCKKLQTGRMSFSRKSGITGTDGWIAPEMIHGRSRTTTAVDVFSLGCVFYYVLSKGKHPFGDTLSRQMNIMAGEFKLHDIVDDKYELWSHLISRMVTIDPLERPSIAVIKNHPAFWNKERILTFLQDVSDRIEKEDVTSKVLIELEMGNSAVLQGDWRGAIEPEIADDLTKYRSYRADSLRDLLRALRNKKHHYRELSDKVREILGSIPDQFVTYWTDRFPKLLLHTWLSMQCVKNEDIFKKYYFDSYSFARLTDDTSVPLWIQQSLTASPRRRFGQKPNPNQKFGDQYAINKYISNFFFTNGKSPSTESNWRVRPSTPNITVTSTNATTISSIPDTTVEQSENQDDAQGRLQPPVQDEISNNCEDDLITLKENLPGENCNVIEDLVEQIDTMAAGDDATDKWQKSKGRTRGRRGKKKPNSGAAAVD